MIRRALLIFLLPLALASCQTGPRGRAAYQPGRLAMDRISALVAAPIAEIEAGREAAGIAAFEALLAAAERRHGRDSLQKADLLESFGVALHMQGEPRFSEAGLIYLRRAIDAYRAYYGPGHPEVAVALNSWADVERLRRPHLPAAAEAALEEAYRIRVAALGPAHGETLWTMLYLAQVRSRMAWTRGEPARIAEVEALLDRAVAASAAAGPELASGIPVAAELRRATLFARNGRRAAAIAAWQTAQRLLLANPTEAACRAHIGANEFEDLLNRPELAGKLAPAMRAEGRVLDACYGPAGQDNPGALLNEAFAD